MYRIAVIDDDVPIGNMVEEVLTREGYEVLRAYSGTEALLLLERQRPDLVLLDLMLPGLSGEEVLPRMEGIPVIVVSARVDVQDKVNLLMDGAADYITKPFAVSELLARIAVQLRQKEQAGGTPNAEQGRLIYEDMELTEYDRRVTAGGVSVHLTRTEYAILHLLMKNVGQVITRSVLLERISEETPDCVESSLKVHISNLRKKLRTAGGREYIEAVWGIGFILPRES
ncbi:MAG: response regulator transcription factor [Lachnospiraceae bacterium]|nr:response regulator transcription factor [Lachnospiraceae bacterium]MDE7434923.1 response regulator transcription factor [Lachnospiraceae bacterium]